MNWWLQLEIMFSFLGYSSIKTSFRIFYTRLQRQVLDICVTQANLQKKSLVFRICKLCIHKLGVWKLKASMYTRECIALFALCYCLNCSLSLFWLKRGEVCLKQECILYSYKVSFLYTFCKYIKHTHFSALLFFL